MDSRYTSTQSSCSKASLPLTTETRYSVWSCVATHRLSLTRHSCREHHRKPFWRTLSGPFATRHCRTNWREVQHVLDGEALLHRHNTFSMSPVYNPCVHIFFSRKKKVQYNAKSGRTNKVDDWQDVGVNKIDAMIHVELRPLG